MVSSNPQCLNDNWNCWVLFSYMIMSKCCFFLPPSPILLTLQAWSKLEELHDIFGSCGVSLIQAKQHFDGDLPQSKKIVLQDKFFQAFSAVSLKLAKYVSEEGHSDICVIKQLPFFYPTRLILYSCDHISALPGMNSVSTTEINRYRESLGPTGCQGVWGNPNQPDSILEQCKFVCS